MELQFKTLQTIYTIVKDQARPLEFPCRPGDIILRQLQGWDIVQSHLTELEALGLVHTRQLETLVIHITAEGFAMIENDASTHPAERNKA